MAKPFEDSRSHDTVAWPGPVGWWYVPLIWLIVVAAAAFAWLFS